MQGAILAATALITKIIGLAYRIPVTNIMGAEGNGYYGMVFQVYNLALMLTSYSLPTAVSKLVSARVATGQYRNAYRVFRGAMTFAIIAGGIVTAIVFFGAGFIATDIMKMDLSVYALRVLAPCILVVAFLGVFRGFFQGFGTMIPTAVSQTVEQIINAIVMIINTIPLSSLVLNISAPFLFDTTETPVPLLIIFYCLFQFFFIKIRPQTICKIKLGISHLPQQIIRKPLFTAGSYHKIRIRYSLCIQISGNRLLGNIYRIQNAVFNIFPHLGHRTPNFISAAIV